METLIIRADASTEIGTGHFMRCLALAQAWRDNGGGVAFITACRSDGLLERLREEGFGIHQLTHPHPEPADWEHTEAILALHPDAWVVLDGYHFDRTYQQRVRESGHKLLVIDDMAHLEHYYADVILNQNLHAAELRYSRESYTQMLLGTRYVLLRREFLALGNRPREIPGIARRVLVTLGGSDPENHTLKVIQAFREVPASGMEATVLIGANNPHVAVLEAAVRQSRIPIRLVRDARNMPELIARADMAVAAAGTTIWELLFLGTPSLVLVLAENQRPGAERIFAEGAGKNLGWAKDLSAETLAREITQLSERCDLRAEMSRNARKIVDGRGARRVVAVMQGITGTLRLQSATAEDCRLLWEWKNESAALASSFDSAPVQWEEHLNWCQRELVDPHCFIYIVKDEKGTPVGQVRFEISPEGTAEIDVSMDVKERNKGYGSTVLRLACRRIRGEADITGVIAHVKEDNRASISAFTRAGFTQKGRQIFKGHRSVKMILEEKCARSD